MSGHAPNAISNRWTVEPLLAAGTAPEEITIAEAEEVMREADRCVPSGSARTRILMSCSPGHSVSALRKNAAADTARAMSQENVEIVRRVYSERARGNFAAGAELFAADAICTWEVPEDRTVSHGLEE